MSDSGNSITSTPFAIENTAPSNSFYINSSGNVGIGTSTPAIFKLQVAGNIGPDADGIYDLGAIGTRFRYTYTTGVFSGNNSLSLNAGTSGNGNITFLTNIGQERMRIDGSTGNVGIGTSTAARKLTISDTNSQILLNDPSATADQRNWALGSLQGNLTFKTVNDAISSSNERMTITNAGNVGIGTTTPDSLLHVYTTAAGQGAHMGSAFTGNWNNIATYAQFSNYAQAGNSSNYALLQDTSGATYLNSVGILHLRNSNVESLTILSNGNVGVGTTTPGYKLTVVGDDGSGNVASFRTGSGATSCTLNSSTGLLNCSSDERLKQDITSLSSSSTLDKVLELNPVSYHWKTDTSTSTLKFGFIAQQVESIFPELVSTDKDTGYKTLSLNGMIPYIVSSIQEMSHRLAALTKWFGNNGDNLNIQGDVCVDGTCITKDRFKAMIQNAANGNVTTASSNQGGGSQGGEQQPPAVTPPPASDTPATEGDTPAPSGDVGADTPAPATDSPAPSGDDSAGQ